MNWKRRNHFQSVKEIVEFHTGMKAEEFLAPKDKYAVKGTDEVISAITEAILTGRKICIVGDYDADGANASANLHQMITELAKQLGKTCDPSVRLPRRFSEGYGLNTKIIEEEPEGCFLITVDNGIAAIPAIREAKKKKMTVVIIDHHLPSPEGLPPADVICDPKAIPGSDFSDYCAAALVYKIAETCIKSGKVLDEMLCRASLATVTDVMPLVEDNRKILAEGLAAANARKGSFGFNKLMDAGSSEHIDEEAYGFTFGPMCNAPERMQDGGAELVYELLLLDTSKKDPDYRIKAKRADELIDELKRLNEKRQNVTRGYRVFAMQQAHEREFDLTGERRKHRAGVFFCEQFSEGTNGITAGDMAEYLHIPCFVFSRSAKDPSILKGSGRTYGDIHLKKLLDRCADVLVGYGGHAGAAGLAIREENLDAFQMLLDEKLPVPDDEEADTLYYDMEVEAREIAYVIEEVKKYAPYGEGNRAPVFKVKNFEETPKNGKFFNIMGKNQDHLKLFGKDVDVLGFDMAGRFQNDGCPKHLDLVGTLSQNYFRGTVRDQIELIDYKERTETRKTHAYRALEDLLVF